MAIVVEDGTGLPNAESPASVQDFIDYATTRGLPGATAAVADIESALRRATDYVNALGSGRWNGTPTVGDQGLPWPRTGATTSYGSSIGSNVVPRQYIHAVLQATSREVSSPNSLTPDFNSAERVVEATVGPLRVKYDSDGSTPRIAIPAVDSLIAELTSAALTSGSVGVVFLGRA